MNKNLKSLLMITVITGLLVGSYCLQRGTFNNIALDSTKTQVSQNNTNVKLVIDKDNQNVLPKNFRMSNDPIDKQSAGNVNLKGLANLNESGSGSLSENGLKMIKDKFKANKNIKNIIDVDLRQEAHGFVEGMSISWFGEKDQANINKKSYDIIKDEKAKLEKIKKDKYVAFDKLKEGKSVNTIPEIINPKKVQTERELAQSQKIHYLRLTISDHLKPKDDQVDLFVKETKKISTNDTWLHFHCRGGVGRTTTFMAMYDMMNNAKQVSFEDIIQRQVLIGGSDILKKDAEGKKIGDENRTDFLKQFYQYSKQNNDNFKTSWSDWRHK
ncbi:MULTISPECIES: phosphatase domain-containing protein [Clostridium]|uniref:Protein tyrosine phosphatase n=1 Tax=Clostridium frigoriphilum TaxID=443253 RepID=A0ABU7UUK2_9CLOT|nr:protein tyrosine phosphatase [Clostridium sp. DSM 17811]MBU3101521.1 protein tyrosine phosphatase [Clostridium sp. DSM 17811]